MLYLRSDHDGIEDLRKKKIQRFSRRSYRMHDIAIPVSIARLSSMYPAARCQNVSDKKGIVYVDLKIESKALHLNLIIALEERYSISRFLGWEVL